MLDPIWTRLHLFGQVWTNLNNFEPILICLSIFGQVWTNLEKFTGQNIQPWRRWPETKKKKTSRARWTGPEAKNLKILILQKAIDGLFQGLFCVHMGIVFQKHLLPTLLQFARARKSHQTHVYICLTYCTHAINHRSRLEAAPLRS